MTTQQLSALINYDKNTILDTSFNAHSKVSLFFLRIFSVLCCCFGVEFPNCQMGDVAKKILEFVSKNDALLQSKGNSLGELDRKIRDLKKKAKNPEAVSDLDSALYKVGCLRDQPLLEASKSYLETNPEVLKRLNTLPPFKTEIDTNAIELGSDYTKDGDDVHFSRSFPCTYQFGVGGTELVMTDGVQTELTTKIKELFKRTDEKVTEDPLLKTIFSYLGPTSCVGLDYNNESDITFSANQGMVLGGQNLENETVPIRFTFIPSDNPNQATIKTESGYTLSKDGISLYLKLQNTIVINREGDKCSASIERHFEEL